MAVLVNSVVVPCSPEVAFDLLSDHRSELEWNPACQEMHKLTDGPVGAGTRYRARWRGPPVELETVAHERPSTWTTHNGGPVEVTLTCTLDPHPAGTRLTAEFRAGPHGWFRLAFPVFYVVIRRQERRNMVSIREWLDARCGDGATATGGGA